MTAALLIELHRKRIDLALDGDRLRIESKGGSLPAALLARVVAAKQELVVLLRFEVRARLHRIAQAEGLCAFVIALPDDDVAECDGLPDNTLRAYLRALHRRRVMDRGEVPEDYTRAAHCKGCGPVMLWQEAPARVVACPWCFGSQRRPLA